MDDPARETPWIETRAGGVFFVNLLLATPILTVIAPLVLGTMLRMVGAIDGPSPIFDTIPLLFAQIAPLVGWLAAPAAWVAWRSLRIVGRPAPRRALLAFLGLHIVTLAFTVWRWTT